MLFAMQKGRRPPPEHPDTAGDKDGKKNDKDDTNEDAEEDKGDKKDWGAHTHTCTHVDVAPVSLICASAVAHSLQYNPTLLIRRTLQDDAGGWASCSESPGATS